MGKEKNVFLFIKSKGRIVFPRFFFGQKMFILILNHPLPLQNFLCPIGLQQFYCALIGRISRLLQNSS